MPSHLTAAPRRVPQQTRGQERVSALLAAASDVLADKGYEAATMCEIAERAHASIGSLYQFFPNKESIACALHTQCGQDVETLWAALLVKTGTFSLEQLLDRLIQVTVHYIDTHPALVALQHAPKSPWNEKVRKRLEQRIARFFLDNKPRLSKPTAEIYAAVCLQIIKACTEQCLKTDGNKRKPLINEYKFLLRCYVGSRLKGAKVQ